MTLPAKTHPSSFRPYPSYKPSGVEWLGEIPEEWEVRRLRFVVKFNPVKSELNGLERDTIVSFVPMDAVGEYGGMRLETDKPLDEVYTGYTYFKNRDVVIAKITPCFENGKGAIAENLTNGIGFGTTEFHVLRSEEDNNERYIFYLTNTHSFRQVGASEMLGAGGQKRIPESFIKDFRLGIPSSLEQKAIADYLDRKTAQIDELIGKKKELIERLKEQRTALITAAVTGKLQSDIGIQQSAMVDSGVEWLGQVPEHWEVKRIKFLTKILRGKFSHRPRNDPRFYDGEYPFIQTGDVAKANKFIETYTQTLNERGLSVSKQFPAGTLVMTIAANIGDMAVLNFDACFPDSIVGFVPDEISNLDYLYYLFCAMRPEFLKTAILNTQMNLNIERIENLSAARPPKNEQQEIVDYLDQKTGQIDGLIGKAEEAIQRLEEYRTAIITAAVTGKIKVDDASASLRKIGKLKGSQMENNDCQYEQCYVAFLDILGFSAMVMESRRKTEILEQLVNCLDTCSCMPSGGKEVTKINGQSLVLDIQTRYCSDTVGFFMRENQIHFPHLLLMIRYLQDRLWELGICLRGGLALGKMYWNPEKPNITLGTGWINAYKLENEVATYPRIVVEEALYNSLRDEREPPYPFGSSPSYRDSIKDYIKRDADGVYFLDLLN